MNDWLGDNPQIRSIRVAAADLNGQVRGKRLPARFAGKVYDDGVRFPVSVMNLDITGADIEGSPLVFDTGDADAPLRPTERGFVPVPWLAAPAALLPVWMYGDDGTPFDGDPRHALARVVDRFTARGLTPVCAVELEFYLLDVTEDGIRMPADPVTGQRRSAPDTLSLQTLDRFDAFFTDLYATCDAMDIPADAAINEAGAGQFEVNLMHCDDALRAADDAWLFKIAVKGVARQHGFTASFMAKPFEDQPGNGLHVHFSVLDQAGANVFDNGGPEGTQMMHHAVAGSLTALDGATLLFAPHANSYARLVPEAHAPVDIAWGYDNRTTAIRIPSGSSAARRIEHRVAGGDVNPYLMLAAVLGGAINGIEDGVLPPAPTKGNAYAQDLPQIPDSWEHAVDAFEHSPHIARIFAPELIAHYTRTKRQELRVIGAMDAWAQRDIYLDTV